MTIPTFMEQVKLIGDLVEKGEMSQALVMAQSLRNYPLDFDHYFIYCAQLNKNMSELVTSLSKAMADKNKEETLKTLKQINLAVATMKDEFEQFTKQIGTQEQKKKFWGL